MTFIHESVIFTTILGSTNGQSLRICEQVVIAGAIHSYFGRVPDLHARLGGGRLSEATSWGLGTQGDLLAELA
jgi:hypothetical protein